MVSATREKRIIMSSGRRNPPSPAITNACHGSSHPARPSPAAVPAISAYAVRRERSRVRRLTRSATTPSPGASRVPPYCSAATTARRNGEPVWTSTYQPRMRFSISKPDEVVTSEPHWKRKLRMRKGARSPRPGPPPARGPCGPGSQSPCRERDFSTDRYLPSWGRRGSSTITWVPGEYGRKRHRYTLSPVWTRRFSSPPPALPGL